MTQARARAKGLVTPPLIQHWLEAALRAFVCLVQGVVTTLGMILNRNQRDWHTTDAHEPLPQAKSDIQPRELSGPPGACPAVDAQRRNDGCCSTTATRENDSAVAAATKLEACKARVPGEGRDPVLREAQTLIHNSALMGAGWTPAFAGNVAEKVARLTHA